MKVLVTGGAGFIGSHTTLELLGKKHDVLIVDNFSNSSPEAVNRIKRLSNSLLTVVEANILNASHMSDIFQDFRPNAVIHFAGLKAVGESSSKPILYYQQNIQGTLCLLEAMQKTDCKSIVFSSSATVYGDPEYLPFDEQHRCAPTNPYGRTKYFIEEILKDWTASQENATAIALRYFNPVGAHSSGIIGEDPNDIPNNLMPFISQVAIGKHTNLNIFGDDYDTPDGTGVRDYLHVVDLARAHLSAINALERITSFEAINLGTGKGVSVLEMVAAFEKVSGKKIPYKITHRRPGDVASCWANTTKAEKLLKWKATHTLDDMCRSAWKWQNENPNGYDQH